MHIIFVALWKRECSLASLARSVAFFLAGADVILDAQRVRKYLLQHGVEEEFEAGRGGVFLHPGQKHGGSLVQRGVMRWVAATGDQATD